MSALDERLLKVSGLSATRVAELLGKTRQAISKGVKGEADYFSESDLRLIHDEIGTSPFLQGRFQEAMGRAFNDLADRFRATRETVALLEALKTAQRIWLMFPNFTESNRIQGDAYAPLFEAFEAMVGERDSLPEVIAFCDRYFDRTAIEAKFANPWFAAKRFATTGCDTVRMAPPMIVIDPHLVPSGYILIDSGFRPLAPHEAAARVQVFGAAVSRRYRPVSEDGMLGEKPFDLIQADVEQVSRADARIDQDQLLGTAQGA